ncbi:MAG TPA: glycosyltransferase family 2 protein [Fimbriimonadaceae bacterium]|nr:glycosyltransferase family 2 protein [Fimbriimonadaceae bacterium]HRJ97571.1 glycosyltransferase family 2 protein [Fimbriimonadaceae bacterium]
MSEQDHPERQPAPDEPGTAVAHAPDVTVLVPALDEQDTIGEVVERLLALPLDLEVIVVDDGSTDRTAEILAAFGNRITVLNSPSPRSGKGSAIRQGLEVALGEVVVIQDADLEYKPEEIPSLVAPILAGKANVVYGTRFAHGLPRGMALPNKLVNKLLVWAVALLYFRRITDEATCYKAIRRTLLLRMHLVCRRFEFCPEVTAKACRLGERIVEMPIHYEPRTKAAGKKIRWTDAPVAFWTLLRHRFGRF